MLSSPFHASSGRPLCHSSCYPPKLKEQRQVRTLKPFGKGYVSLPLHPSLNTKALAKVLAQESYISTLILLKNLLIHPSRSTPLMLSLHLWSRPPLGYSTCFLKNSSHAFVAVPRLLRSTTLPFLLLPAITRRTKVGLHAEA